MQRAYGSRPYPDLPNCPASGTVGDVAGLRGGSDAGGYSGSLTGGLRRRRAHRGVRRWQGEGPRRGFAGERPVAVAAIGDPKPVAARPGEEAGKLTAALTLLVVAVKGRAARG